MLGLSMGILRVKFPTKVLFVILIAAGLVLPGFSHSQERLIRFGIPDVGYPPYLMRSAGDLHGIVGDTFVELASALGYHVEIVIQPVKRLRRDMKRGKIDAMANALEWESDTTNSVWTEGIIRVSDNVVMTADRQMDIANLDDLRDTKVVLMFGYTYPSLESMIETGAFEAHRTNRFESLLKMVDYKRVDYGIIDMNVARWVIRTNNLLFDPPLFFATPGFDEVEYRIILFSQKWAPFVQEFNAALVQFKSNGRLENILNKYR